MAKDFTDKIYDLFMANKMGHAFLIETNDIDKTCRKIQGLLKKINCPSHYEDHCHEECNICFQIDNFCLPSIKYVEPTGQVIKKEQIMEVKDQFVSNSLLIKYNAYIIKKAERLNASSANVLLKFLEDPVTETLAFFVLNNKKNIISTIKSRCQVFKDLSSNDDNLELSSEEFNSKVNIIFKNLLLEKEFSLISNKKEVLSLADRKEQEQFLSFILLKLDMEIKKHLKEEEKSEAFGRFSLKNLISFAKITKDTIEKAGYNVNMELLLDDYFIKMGELIL